MLVRQAWNFIRQRGRPEEIKDHFLRAGMPRRAASVLPLDRTKPSTGQHHTICNVCVCLRVSVIRVSSRVLLSEHFACVFSAACMSRQCDTSEFWKRASEAVHHCCNELATYCVSFFRGRVCARVCICVDRWVWHAPSTHHIVHPFWFRFCCVCALHHLCRLPRLFSDSSRLCLFLSCFCADETREARQRWLKACKQVSALVRTFACSQLRTITIE